MEVYMESVKAFKFMNGWMVKHKDIDKIEEAILVLRFSNMEFLLLEMVLFLRFHHLLFRYLLVYL